MSIYRSLVRMAVVTALNNHMREPWPTLAGGNIFDSKIEPVEDMATDRAFPAAVIYTDYDKDNWSYGHKIHAARLMTVTIELLVVQAAELDASTPTYQLECPITDSEIETTLDIFETQVYRALVAGNPASDLFAYLCSSYENVVSRRGASVEGGQRLAARQITLEMRSVRDNTQGTIPEPIAAFLADIEAHRDFADRADDIRTALTAPALLPADARKRLAVGWSRDLAARMGGPTGAQVLLPAGLTFLDSHGNTL